MYLALPFIANNTILNEITEDDTKDTSDPVIVNNFSNHARPQKLRKKRNKLNGYVFHAKEKGNIQIQCTQKILLILINYNIFYLQI